MCSAGEEHRHLVEGRSIAVACRYWTGVDGSCRWGDNCHFHHSGNVSTPAAAQPKPCRAWTGELGSCRFGAACRFWHEAPAAESQHGAECCVCLEVPAQGSGTTKRAVYGLLEACEHVVCMACVMTWRQNRNVSREARLGCPVCREVSYIVVPWPKAVLGDEKLAVIEQHRERCKATPCKWSTSGQACPAGKYCIYDHSLAPQIRHGRNRSSLRRLQNESSDEWSEMSSDDELETDDDIAERLLRQLRR
eukprot:gb/GFBE01061259.1/.p1 GENE.gb/GFBE01061259.1/~~gb/GFBE01061259.1/.p1  ORF type:complete len:249 (+),score=37.49 gb/GFBE01061259.1/:1-747(+)